MYEPFKEVIMSLIKKPNELSTKAVVNMLVYGQPGIGKTTLALSMPKPLMIDCDGGVHRVQPHLLSDTVEVDSWETVDEVLKEDLGHYITLVFDTGGKLIDYMTAHILQKYPKMNNGSGGLSLQGYGVRKVMFQNLLARINTTGKHVLFVAHEREERDGDLRYVRPEIGGSSGNDLIKELDMVGYMEAIGTKRVIKFNPQEKFYAKNSLELPDTMHIPDTSKGNKFLKEIVDFYDGKLAERQKQVEDYERLVLNFKDVIEGIESAQEANEVIDEIRKANHIWDSKYQCSLMMRAKAKELKLEFVASTGKYKVEKKTKPKKNEKG